MPTDQLSPGEHMQMALAYCRRGGADAARIRDIIAQRKANTT